MTHNQTGLKRLIGILLLLGVMGSAWGEDNPMVKIETSKGALTMELYADKSPASVENFLHYVNEGFYDGLIFHRVIPGFMVQGGGFESGMKPKETTRDPVQNEADNGLENERGTLALARTSDPHSATAQFFVNVVDNDFLNHQEKSPRGWGYAVFGRITEGMDVIDAIVALPTKQHGPHGDVPQEEIIITRAVVINDEE